MSNFVTVSRIVIAITPALLDAVKAAETHIPFSGQGASKLAFVRTVLESVYEMTGDRAVDFEVIWSAAERVINFVVATYNRLGIFRK